MAAIIGCPGVQACGPSSTGGPYGAFGSVICRQGFVPLAWVAIGMALLSGVIVVALGLGWVPPGGSQFAAFGVTPPRFLVPWACTVMAVLAVVLTASTTIPAWRFPRLTRVSVGLGEAALGAQTVVMGWVVDAEGLAASVTGGLGWSALVSGLVVAAASPRWVHRYPIPTAAAAGAPFLLVLLVWATASTSLPRDLCPSEAARNPGGR